MIPKRRVEMGKNGRKAELFVPQPRRTVMIYMYYERDCDQFCPDFGSLHGPKRAKSGHNLASGAREGNKLLRKEEMNEHYT